jgi:hypothetical protein
MSCFYRDLDVDTVKPVLRGHLWDKQKVALQEMVTSSSQDSTVSIVKLL